MAVKINKETKEMLLQSVAAGNMDISLINRLYGDDIQRLDIFIYDIENSDVRDDMARLEARAKDQGIYDDILDKINDEYETQNNRQNGRENEQKINSSQLTKEDKALLLAGIMAGELDASKLSLKPQLIIRKIPMAMYYDELQHAVTV